MEDVRRRSATEDEDASEETFSQTLMESVIGDEDAYQTAPDDSGRDTASPPQRTSRRPRHSTAAVLLGLLTCAV